jgi:spore germination cell wall hydrolase CwlJ-like protein
MKINLNIDTNVIKASVKEKATQVWERSDAGHVFLGCVSAFLLVYIAFDKIPNLFKKDSCCVDVTLESPDRKYPNSNDVPPKTKHAQLFNTGVRINLSSKEFDCLARNVYFEAKFEPYIGKIAVAQITYNRVKSGRWGNNFCDVVNAKKQFSWRLFKRMREEVPKGMHWIAATHAATMFTKGVRIEKLKDSDHYFASYIKPPKWSKSMKHITDIGLHKFYASN